MKSKVLFSTLYSLMLVFIFTFDISAQDKATSNGLVPTAVYKSSPVFITPANPNNYAGRAFAYNSSGSVIPKGPFKFFLNNPSSPVSLAFDPNSSNFVAAGSFDVYGNWWGVRYGNLQVVKIDTNTGAITTVGTVTGAKNITGLAWDFSTSTMYASNYNNTNSTVGTLNLTAYVPSSAGSYSFLAQAFDTSHSVIVTTPITSCPINMWPANVKASVSNIFGIDSVWVRWYKNYPSNGWKRFNLSRGTGNNWSGIFNSNSGEVNVGDSISYRIIARNASTQHNLDSTALYTFMIDLFQNPIVGTDTLSGNFPFTTYWMDGRTDYLYTHEELNNLPSIVIWGIGFDIINADPGPMNEFTIKMQNTTATSISGFTESGWTTVYSNVYTVPGTGWQIINLTTPFFTNGTNLLVEICYNNSYYTNYSTVRTSPTAGNDYWGRYGDLLTAGGCGYTGWTSSVGPIGKANTIFETIIDNIKNTGTGIPETYALSQNYPNPFNPTTKINFSIPKSGMVSLKVYDILGKEVSTLVNQNISAGNYTYEFDASRLSSGIYFYRLNVNGFSEVKKMSLIK